MKTVNISLADGSLLCTAEVADNLRTRGVGLLGRRGLSEKQGLLIQPCTSVHTVFMRFPIDVVYLDAEGLVVKSVQDMRAFRFSLGGKGAKRVLELPSGALAQAGVAPGDRLTIGPATLPSKSTAP
jgi:uncharacterized protein